MQCRNKNLFYLFGEGGGGGGWGGTADLTLSENFHLFQKMD